MYVFVYCPKNERHKNGEKKTITSILVCDLFITSISTFASSTIFTHSLLW